MDHNKVEFLTVFAVHEGDTDRSNGIPKWFFTTKEAADFNAQGAGFFGGKATISVRKAVNINGNTYILDNDGNSVQLDVSKKEVEEIKKAALGKLSEYEKKLLGIK